MGVAIVIIAVIVVAIAIAVALVARRKRQARPVGAEATSRPPRPEPEPMHGLEDALNRITDRSGATMADRLDAEATHIDEIRVSDDTGPLLRRALDHVTPHEPTTEPYEPDDADDRDDTTA